MNWFIAQGPFVQALLVSSGAWLATVAGSSLVFFRKEIGTRLLGALTGFSSGTMLAIAFFALLAPALALAPGSLDRLVSIAIVVAGGATLMIVRTMLLDRRVASGQPRTGAPATLKKSTYLTLATALHNVPQGLAIGLIFAAVRSGSAGLSIGAGLAVGIAVGVQNIPEGVSVAVPLRTLGVRSSRSFWYGQASGFTEPVAAAAAALAGSLFPRQVAVAMLFTAGAMISTATHPLPVDAAGGRSVDWLPSLSLLTGFSWVAFLYTTMG